MFAYDMCQWICAYSIEFHKITLDGNTKGSKKLNPIFKSSDKMKLF